jgi:hypothetical protein
MIKEFDKIKLKSGDIGYIADKLDDTPFYADVSMPAGDISTILITLADIASVFVETEIPCDGAAV